VINSQVHQETARKQRTPRCRNSMAQTIAKGGKNKLMHLSRACRLSQPNSTLQTQTQNWAPCSLLRHRYISHNLSIQKPKPKSRESVSLTHLVVAPSDLSLSFTSSFTRPQQTQASSSPPPQAHEDPTPTPQMPPTLARAR
jgi:hypothetical protein